MTENYEDKRHWWSPDNTRILFKDDGDNDDRDGNNILDLLILNLDEENFSAFLPLRPDGDGYTVCEDCDDNDPDIFPGNTESCDGIDNNCDGQVDEGCANVDNSGPINIYDDNGKKKCFISILKDFVK